MAEKSGFFDSINQDRLYNSSFFSEYFASFIGNGVFSNPSTSLQVLEDSGMTVNLSIGKGFINGVYYSNTTILPFILTNADGVLNRIDRIVLAYNTSNREITAEVRQGEYNATPVATDLQQDDDIYELGLADVYVGAGVTAITQSNITDLRLNNTYCGVVTGVVEQADTTTIFNQYQDWFDEIVDGSYLTKSQADGYYTDKSADETITGEWTFSKPVMFSDGANVVADQVGNVNLSGSVVKWTKLARIKHTGTGVYNRAIMEFKLLHTGSYIRWGSIKVIAYKINGNDSVADGYTSSASSVELKVINDSSIDLDFSAQDIRYQNLIPASGNVGYIDLWVESDFWSRVYANLDFSAFESGVSVELNPNNSTLYTSIPSSGTTEVIDAITYTAQTAVNGSVEDLFAEIDTSDEDNGRYASAWGVDDAILATLDLSSDELTITSGETTGTATLTTTPSNIRNWGNLKVDVSDLGVSNDAEVEIYNIDEYGNTWDETSGGTTSGNWAFSTTVGTKIYVRQTASPYRMWIYDTETNTWDETSGGAPSGNWVYSLTVGTKIYVRQYASPYRMWIYDTEDDTWDETSGGTPSNDWEFPTTVGIKIYAKQDSSPYRMWIYDTTTNTWDTSSGGAPSGNWEYPITVGTKIYVRQTASPYKIWIYDTEDDTWDETSGGTPSNDWIYSSTVGTKIYVRQTASPYRMWIYDTEDDTWYETSGGAPSDSWIYLSTVGTKIYVKQAALPYRMWIYTTEDATTTLTSSTLTNGENIIDLSSINATTYPSINILYTLSRDTTGNTSPTVYNHSVTWEGEGSKSGLTLIDETTLTATAASYSVDVSATDYTNIIIEVTDLKANNVSPSSLRMRFNSVSTGSYYITKHDSGGATISNGAGATYVGIGDNDVSGSSETASRCYINVNLPTQTAKYTTNIKRSTSPEVQSGDCSFIDETAISSIQLYPAVNSFAIGTKFTVYGVNKYD